MFGMSLTEILVILLVTLLVVGPEKIPELARWAGRGMRELRRASNMLRDTIMLDEMPQAPEPRYAQNGRNPARAPVRENFRSDLHAGAYPGDPLAGGAALAVAKGSEVLQGAAPERGPHAPHAFDAPDGPWDDPLREYFALSKPPVRTVLLVTARSTSSQRTIVMAPAHAAAGARPVEILPAQGRPT